MGLEKQSGVGCRRCCTGNVCRSENRVAGEVLDMHVADSANAFGIIAFLENRGAAISCGVGIYGVASEAAVDIFNADISDGRCNAEHSDYGVTAFGVNIFDGNILDAITAKVEIFNAFNGIVRIERYHIVVSLSEGKRADIAHGAVLYVAAEMYTILIVTACVACEADVFYGEIMYLADAKIKGNGISQHHIGKGEIFNADKVEDSSRIALFIEKIGLGVFFSCVVAVPDAAADGNVHVAAERVAVGKEEIVSFSSSGAFHDDLCGLICFNVCV